MSIMGLSPDPSPGGGGGGGGGGSQEELMNQLRIFLEGASKEKGGSLRLSSIALNLLKNLPGARDAVFEYYSGLLDRILNHYNPQSESLPSCSPEDEAIVSELQDVLSGFIEANPRSWAPVVSKWSLDTLGKLSYQYGSKMTAKGAGKDKFKGEKKGSGTLHEKVSCWLGCIASRFLIEISAECLSKQIDENTEGCISALLETSVNHTPYFDWVVAHLGSCFPHTLIRRVLSLGLKEFISIASVQKEQEGSIQINKVPKLMSVMNILSHLGRNHQSVLQESIHSMILSSLADGSSSVNQQSAVPYILHLSALSPALSQALVLDLVNLLSPQINARIHALIPAWDSQFFIKENSLLDLVAQILISTDRGVPEILVLMLEKGGSGEVSEFTRGCRMIINYVLAALFQQVHGATRHRDSIPAFQYLNQSISVLLEHLISSNQFLKSSAIQILSLYALNKGRTVTVQILKFLLYRCETEDQLTVLSNFLSRVEIFHYNCINDLVAESLRNKEGRMILLLENLLKLVEMEKVGRQEYRSSFQQGVRANQSLMMEKLLVPEYASTVLNMLRIVGIDRKMRVSSLHRLSYCLVELYFATLVMSNLDRTQRETTLALTETIFREVCRHRTGLQILLRFFLEASINSPYSVYLGCKDPESTVSSNNSNQRSRESAKLFRDNFKFWSMPVQPLGSSTVFHAGVIGHGKRSNESTNPITEEDSLVYRGQVSGLILRLCQSHHSEEEGSKKLALILVEIISPDIMYNGIPWPEEDFIKVTMERDLYISRTVENHPILWTLLELLALNKPSLCYCSVIVRAIVSVCITHWQSTVSSNLSNYPQQRELTRKIITLMGSGQFIPVQLSVLAEMLHILDPSQLHCILIDIWNYMRVNVPGPSIFQVCDKSGVIFRDFGAYEDFKPYCDRLRMVMVANLEKVADLFKVYFVDVAKSSVPVVNGEAEQV